MKIINKAAAIGLGLALMGSSAFAQSLADARKAIDAEQFQKAKSMLKNLVSTQSTKGENYFYLGWVYIKQDYVDSAKATFQKGIAADANSALNYVGLGVAAHLDKDAAGTTSNFSQAIAKAGKDTKPYVYMGKGYLLPVGGAANPTQADAQAALDILNKGIEAAFVRDRKHKNDPASSTDPEIYMTMGEADRILLKSNDAYTNFSTAQTLDPKSPNVYVALGVLWKYADNFDDAEKQFQQAINLDPNYGPAYREWAETDYRWAQSDPSKADAKIKEAVQQYQKYLSLTDTSPESEMRYADFLINAGDYKTLQQVATDLSKTAGSNLRAYRYIMYSAVENKDYSAAVAAGNTWITKADPKRVIPLDYIYLGRAQLGMNDSTGVATLKKALSLDSTRTQVYGEIANFYYAQKKWGLAGDAFATYIAKGGRKVTLNDYFREAYSYFRASSLMAKPDTVMLNKADSALSYVQHKMQNPPPVIIITRAEVNDAKDIDRNNIKGLGKPYYEQFLAMMTDPSQFTADDKKNYVEACDYLGNYYYYKEKDVAKATDYYTKAHNVDPTDKISSDFLKRKPGAKSM
ncbi:MAG: tetratricopeptide repeat protein [Bacteroidetes bacterium]|nr:tetratricopeptide repeat protein [Bacteroidota bacterium]